MLFDSIGEIETSPTALRTRNDKQVREPMTVNTKESFCPLRLPLTIQRLTITTLNHVER